MQMMISIVLLYRDWNSNEFYEEIISCINVDYPQSQTEWKINLKNLLKL